MKTMTCKQLGGPCDLPLREETADDVIKAQDRHLKEAVANGDDTHMRRVEAHEGEVEEPDLGSGVVPEGQARFRCASRRLTRADLAPVLGAAGTELGGPRTSRPVAGALATGAVPVLSVDLQTAGR